MGEQEKIALKWRKTMKFMATTLAVTASLISAPAFAGKGQSLNVNAAIITGKGGLVGTLLQGNAASAVNLNVASTKRGIVGLLLGGGSSGRGGGGGCGC
jgi:hypothetical protein